jgi:DNA-binding MarR family transcriptional regulator
MDKNFSNIEENAWISWVRSSEYVMESVEQTLKDHGFPQLVWYDALLELDFSAEGKLRLQELGEKMLLKKFNVTRLVDRLEKQGLVEREICESDARGTYAVITADGKKLRSAMWPCYRNAVREHFHKNLTEDELETLIKLVNKLNSKNIT